MVKMFENFKIVLFFSIGLSFGLLIYGAIPFLTMPTLGQAVGTTVGWAQSFINDGWFSIYSHNFGYPEPAARSFGLVGVITTGFFMRLGLHGADAYSLMAVFWLTVAFLSAYKIGRFFGVQHFMSTLGAVLWLSMPIIWAHAGYSMLSLGIGLLPFYFWAALNLFLSNPLLPKPSIFFVGMYVFITLIAVFMDGYSFMMFAVGSSLLCVYIIIVFPNIRKRTLLISIPVHIVSLSLAYFLYTLYIGKTGYESHSIDFFRGWGLDLSFIAIPTQGQHWIFDSLCLSTERTNELYFGDRSVWETTFFMPILLVGLFGYLCIRNNTKLASGLLLIAVFGFYMALGPSLKINSTKPEVMQQTRPRGQSALMPSDLAIAPTGSAWIPENLPGFNSMRASYRWSALGIFIFWMLLILSMGKVHSKYNKILGGVVIFLIVLNLPNLGDRLVNGTAFRKMFFDIDSNLIAELEKNLNRNEIVAFIPYGNDLMVNYIASKINIRTYNIGGDKNLNSAKKNWPSAMKKINYGQLESNHVQDILISSDSNVVVIPYFDALWAVHLWPCVEEAKYITERLKDAFKEIPNFECPSSKNQKFLSAILSLKKAPYLVITESNLFTTIRLKPEFISETGRAILMNKIFENIDYPISIKPDVNNISFVLSDGWHAVEPTHVWSSASATINLPVPKICQDKKCIAVLNFSVYGASDKRPVSVKFSAKDRETSWSNVVLATGTEAYEVSVPLQSGASNREFSIEIPNATSPMALSASPDGRTLGISLRRIDLQISN